jgi:hypothetical protein
VTSLYSLGLLRLSSGSISKPAPDTNCGVASIGGLLVTSLTQLLALDTMSEYQVIPFICLSDVTSSMEVEVSLPSAPVEMPNWSLVIYNQLEGQLGQIECFICETQ